MTALSLAAILGIAAGLRTFTPVAAVLLARGGFWSIIFTLAAAAEYVLDILPSTPSRTAAVGVAARIVSGAFSGWTIVTLSGGSGIAGAVAGIAGALIGTYGGHAARIAAMARIGSYPAAIAEDLIAVALAAFAVTR